MFVTSRVIQSVQGVQNTPQCETYSKIEKIRIEGQNVEIQTAVRRVGKGRDGMGWEKMR